jgi:hypothetical protein
VPRGRERGRTRRCRAGRQEAWTAVATPWQREDVGGRPAGGTAKGGGGAQGLGEELVDDDGDGGAKPEQHREEGEGPRRRTGRRRRRGAAGGSAQEGERRTKTGEGRWAVAHAGKSGRLGEAAGCGRRKGIRNKADGCGLAGGMDGDGVERQ